MLAEFNDRLVRTFSVLFLPFLAIPFALGSRRAHRAYGIAFGLIALAVYNEVLGVGKSLVAAGFLPVLAGQWLPFALFAAGSCFLFYRAAYQVPRGGALPLPYKQLDSLRRSLGAQFGVSRRQQP